MRSNLSADRRKGGPRKEFSKPPPPSREFTFTDDDFHAISRLVYSKTGIVLKDHKSDMVYSRLARRLRALGLKSFADYRHLIGDPDGEGELGFLVNAVTTNLTHFFREIHHFKHLAEVPLRQFSANYKKGKGKHLRIWSAGCSSGAEPYSIAMTMRRSLPSLSSLDAKILASDLDTSMLDNGRSGTYPIDMLEKIPERFASKFIKVGKGSADGTFDVSPSLKEMITFNQLNLLNAWPMKGLFDAIFCRNVMIYFDNPTKEKLVERFAKYLKPHGYLYVGHSESVNKIETWYEPQGQTIYRKK
jgi:chemotaxis protein methyltransferase CheR